MITILRNANIVTENEVLLGYSLTIKGDKISGIRKSEEDEKKDFEQADEVIDLKGAYILPGIIDIHADMIENIIQPRSTALMDFEMGLDEAEKQLAGCGITTIFHSVSMYKEGSWDTKEIRSPKSVHKLAKLIKEMRLKPHMINNRYHLRYEVDNVEALEAVKNLIKEGYVDLLSIMDHTPCQGQYKDLSIYRKHLPGEGKNLTDEEFENLVQKELKKEKVEGKQLKELIDIAKDKGIGVSSHDDDTVQKIYKNKELGVGVSEFPINLETAKAAVQNGMMTLFGAPNILRGKSHSGNVSAIDAIKEGCASILCSDYYPQALLRAVFKLYKEDVLPLNKACNMVSLNPAKAAKIDDITGSIELGKQADFIVVQDERLLQTWVKGRQILSIKYLEEGV